MRLLLWPGRAQDQHTDFTRLNQSHLFARYPLDVSIGGYQSLAPQEILPLALEIGKLLFKTAFILPKFVELGRAPYNGNAKIEHERSGDEEE